MKKIAKKSAKKTANKNPNIELLRILACMMVIGCHTYLWYVDAEGHCINHRLLFAMFCANGVAIFWFITGFFFFKNSSYKKLVLGNIRRIVLPMLLIGLFAYHCGDFLCNKSSLVDNLKHGPRDYLHIVKSMMMGNNPFGYMEPTWYLYVFIIVILTFPLWKQLVVWLDSEEGETTSIKKRKLYMLVTLSALVINDIVCNQLFEFAHHSIRGAVPAAVFIVWGHVLYKENARCDFRSIRWLALLGFVIITLAGFMIQKLRYDNGINDNSIMYWFSTVGLMATVCLVVFVLNIKIPKLLVRPICLVGNTTFGIYLIHALVLAVLRNRFGLFDKIYNKYQILMPLTLAELLYDVTAVVVVFAVSFALVVIVKHD